MPKSGPPVLGLELLEIEEEETDASELELEDTGTSELELEETGASELELEETGASELEETGVSELLELDGTTTPPPPSELELLPGLLSLELLEPGASLELEPGVVPSELELLPGVVVSLDEDDSPIELDTLETTEELLLVVAVELELVGFLPPPPPPPQATSRLTEPAIASVNTDFDIVIERFPLLVVVALLKPVMGYVVWVSG